MDGLSVASLKVEINVWNNQNIDFLKSKRNHCCNVMQHKNFVSQLNFNSLIKVTITVLQQFLIGITNRASQQAD